MSWSISEPIHPGPRLEACGVVLEDGRVLVTAGSSAIGASAILDPATLTWSPTKGALPGERHRHGLVRLPDNRVLAIGGGGDHHALARCDVFDPHTETWSPAPPLSTARRSLTCVQLGGRVLALGGFDQRGSATTVVEAWTPGATAWVTLPPIPPLWSTSTYSACPLADGTVFVTDGYDAWQFDATTAAWSAVGTKLIQFRPALVAFDGGIAMLGGDLTVGALAQTRSWSPAASWRDGIALPSRRAGCDALVLDDGRIAIVGGYEIETTTRRRELTGGELDFEYRCETSESSEWHVHSTVLIGTPGHGWESVASPPLGPAQALRLPDAIAVVRRNGSVAVWRR